MLIRTLASSMLMVSCAQAGTVLETLTRDLEDGEESVTKTYAQSGKLRIDAGNTNDDVMIFRDETIYVIDPKEKSYIAMDRAGMKRMAEQLNPALQMLQQQLANLPPEQRAQLEQMLGQKMPQGGQAPKREIRKTSRTATVAGHGCTYAEVLQNGTLVAEMCVAPANLKAGKDLYDAGVKVGAMIKEMLESIDLPLLQGMANSGMEDLERLGGLPLLTRTFESGKAVAETTVKSIRAETLAENLFDIPSGYRRKELPTFSQ